MSPNTAIFDSYLNKLCSLIVAQINSNSDINRSITPPLTHHTLTSTIQLLISSGYDDVPLAIHTCGIKHLAFDDQAPSLITEGDRLQKLKQSGIAHNGQRFAKRPRTASGTREPVKVPDHSCY
jgi:hypothetical protein